MEPEFLATWQAGFFPTEEALDCFDGLPPVSISELIGHWRGKELATGHPLDGLLGACGWYGKAFEDSENVSPLLFGDMDDLIKVDPAKLPLRLLRHYPALLRVEILQKMFRRSLPVLSTNQPTARLRLIEHRHVLSAALVYDAHPIIDHFRRIDETRLLGLMDLRFFEQPYFFLLQKKLV